MADLREVGFLGRPGGQSWLMVSAVNSDNSRSINSGFDDEIAGAHRDDLSGGDGDCLPCQKIKKQLGRPILSLNTNPKQRVSDSNSRGLICSTRRPICCIRELPLACANGYPGSMPTIALSALSSSASANTVSNPVLAPQRSTEQGSGNRFLQRIPVEPPGQDHGQRQQAKQQQRAH